MKIPIVDENDNIIGEEERSIIHRDGILHREAHVCFVTPKGNIIFQKREMNKETYPGLLDMTVGGHVDSKNDTYEQTAERESLEETGVDVSGKLIFIEKQNFDSYDKVTGLKNNKFTTVFAYLFRGDTKDLKLEDNEALGFEIYSLTQLENLNEDEKKKFIPRMVSREFIDLYRKIISKINEN